MKTLRKIGAQEFFDEFKPCEDYYPLERIEELWGGQELTALDILDLDLPARDRIWGATRLIDDRTNLLLTADFLEHRLQGLGITDTESVAVQCVATIRAYAAGESSHKDLVAAYKAARAAYRAARAAYYAAHYAACDAAYYAAHYAARAAAYNAAYLAEPAWGIARIREVLS